MTYNLNSLVNVYGDNHSLEDFNIFDNWLLEWGIIKGRIITWLINRGILKNNKSYGKTRWMNNDPEEPTYPKRLTSLECSTPYVFYTAVLDDNDDIIRKKKYKRE